MEEAIVTATFGPAAADQTLLSKHRRQTLAALYRHPLPHNLDWKDVIHLFEALGTVDHKSHNQVAFSIGDGHHTVHKPHGKDLMADDVMALRHLLTGAGWAPDAVAPAGTALEAPVEAPDVLAAVDHHETRLYHLDVAAADMAAHTIRPRDPHHILHHLSHKDHPREHGQRSPEDQQYYQAVAAALAGAGRIVLVGHGKGHSNAAHHLAEYLAEHHRDIAARVVQDGVADLSAITAPQLLDVGRRALTA